MPGPSNGKRFYGSITVSERGQIVIPVEARRDFAIEVGDKLLVFGDLEKGMGIIKASMLLEQYPDFLDVLESETRVPKDRLK